MAAAALAGAAFLAVLRGLATLAAVLLGATFLAAAALAGADGALAAGLLAAVFWVAATGAVFLVDLLGETALAAALTTLGPVPALFLLIIRLNLQLETSSSIAHTA